MTMKTAATDYYNNDIVGRVAEPAILSSLSPRATLRWLRRVE